MIKQWMRSLKNRLMGKWRLSTKLAWLAILLASSIQATAGVFAEADGLMGFGRFAVPIFWLMVLAIHVAIWGWSVFLTMAVFRAVRWLRKNMPARLDLDAAKFWWKWSEIGIYCSFALMLVLSFWTWWNLLSWHAFAILTFWIDLEWIVLGTVASAFVSVVVWVVSLWRFNDPPVEARNRPRPI